MYITYSFSFRTTKTVLPPAIFNSSFWLSFLSLNPRVDSYTPHSLVMLLAITIEDFIVEFAKLIAFCKFKYISAGIKIDNNKYNQKLPHKSSCVQVSLILIWTLLWFLQIEWWQRYLMMANSTVKLVGKLNIWKWCIVKFHTKECIDTI